MAVSSTLVDRVKIFAESSGNGPFVLGNAVPAFRGAEALIDGLTYSYAVESGSDYEVGQGVYVEAVNQLIRAPTISSANGAPVSFPANVSINFTALAADLLTRLEGSGTVTSVSGSGGTTGLTLTGGPIELAGVLTLGGTLGVANGGTGGTTASEARTGLGLGNVDNTSDANKPVSTATQVALNAKVAIADLAATTGAGLVGFSQTAPNTGDTVGERLAQEIWVTDAPYNADPTGATDASTAFQAAISALTARGGGTVRFRGTFRINTTLLLPAEPVVIDLRGEGFAASRLVQGTANTPIVTKVSGVSRIVGARHTGFTVQAHASSVKATTTNVLIDIHGFDSSVIRIAYLSASGATSTNGCAYAVISGHANNGPCYQNSIYLKMHQTQGPEKGVWLHNGGAGTSLANANANEVCIWAYGVLNLGSAVDGGDTTQMIVKFSIIEDCPGSTGVIAGNFTKTRSNWIELVDTSIRYGVTADTTANNCISDADQFSGTNKIVIHSSIAGPPRFNDPLFGTMTFHNQSAAATTNYILPTLARATPAVPTISWLIIGATTTIDAAAVRLRPDHHGIVTTMATYSATPLGTGRDALSITPPAGYEIMNATVGIEEITLLGVGTAVRPVALSADPAGKNYVVYWPNTNNHQVNVRVTMRAIA